jgi:hypothetical protein
LGRSLDARQNSRIGDPVECPSFERSYCNRKILDTAGKDGYLFEATSSARIEVYTRRMACLSGLVECVLGVKYAFDKKLCSFETCF